MSSMLLRLALVLAVLSVAMPAATAAEPSGSSTANAGQTEARIPYKSTPEASGLGAVTRVIGGFMVVALLALAAVYGLKRFFPSFYAHSADGSRRIQVVEIRRLTPRATLFLVELDGVHMLLAQSGDRIVNLHRVDAGPADSRDTPVSS